MPIAAVLDIADPIRLNLTANLASASKAVKYRSRVLS